VKEMFAALLKDQSPEPHEREKSPAERKVIMGILRCLPEFIRAYGGRPIDGLSETTIHLVDEVAVSGKRGESFLEDDVAGRYDFARQRVIVLPDMDSLLTTAHRVIHELLHMESFLSFSAEAEAIPHQPAKTNLHPRRIGLSVFNHAQTKRFFRDLDEATVEELTARFDSRYLANIPELAAELRRRAEFCGQVKGAFRNEIASVASEKLPDGRWKTTAQSWRYGAARRRLQDLVAKLYAANRERFTSEEEVFDLFAKAVFKGTLLDLGQLIEKTLGKGAFRELGEQTMLAA